MKKFQIIKNIKKFQETPVDNDWLKDGRRVLADFIVDNPVRKPEFGRQRIAEGIFKQLIFKPMPIAIIALIVTLLTGGGVVSAAQNSLPTDILYPVKLATETVQESLTFDKVKKIELQTQLAEKRLDEIQKIQEQGKAKKEVIEPTLANYQQHIQTAQTYLNEINSAESPAKAISSAVKLEKEINQQQETLDSIAAQAPTEYKSSITSTIKATLGRSTAALEKVESRVKEIKKEDLPTITSQSGIKIEITEPTVGSEGRIYIPDLAERAKNHLSKSGNKIGEVRKKIDTLNYQKDKCDPAEKQNYIRDLETYYQKMKMALEQAQKLFNENDYSGSLSQSNYVFALAIDVDNLIGKWNSRCGQGDEGIEIREVPLNQKFNVKIGETVAVENNNVTINLEDINNPTCPPCPAGQVCPLMCPAPTAKFIISNRNQEGMRTVKLFVGAQKENIGKNIYLQLLGINKKSATLILTEKKSEPEIKEVYLNQKFDLIVNQTARLVDYNNLKIKFQSVMDVICVKAPCPSPLAQFNVEWPAKCQTNSNNSSSNQLIIKGCASTGKEFNLAAGQFEAVFGAKVTLIALTDKTATLIITVGNNACMAPNCLGVYPTGEYDKNGCPIYKCPTEPPQTCSVQICKNGEPENTGRVDSKGCPIYDCPEKKCAAIFSSCDCAYRCVETTPDSPVKDCTKLCRPEETNNYQPTCGYKDEFCQDLKTDNGGTACIEVYDPVCGINEKTYSNSCFAGLAGVTVKCNGQCPCEKETENETTGSSKTPTIMDKILNPLKSLFQ